jgi:hypothetical protein
LHQVIVDNIDILATPDEEEAIKGGVDNVVLEELY